MSSNLTIRVELNGGTEVGTLVSQLAGCVTKCGFAFNEEPSLLSEQGRRIGKGGHLPFVIHLRVGIGPATVWLKFCDYATVNRIVVEPGEHLWVDAMSYSSTKRQFILSLYELSRCIFEKCNAMQVVGHIHDQEEPWYRISRSEPNVPLPDLPIF